MKKIKTILTTVFLVPFFAFATFNTGRVEGEIIGASKPVEAATVSLLRAKDSSLVKMALSSKTGFFEVEKVAEGKYLVMVSAVGYEKYYSTGFEITENSPKFKMSQISLNVLSKGLKDVTVTAKRAFVEQKMDRTLINVDASPTNAGLTAMDILEKSPGISVDKDGNISLKGKAGVMVMVDGKPTYLSAQDLANMLKNMASTQLDQIEIMTNPPAKYDASGNSGVINIKTKRNKTKGFNGSVTLGAGYGINGKTNNSLNLNYRNGKWNVFGNYSYNWNKGRQELNLIRNFRDLNSGEIITVFEQFSEMTPNFRTHSAKMGADFFASKKTTLGVVFTGFVNPGTFTNNSATYIKDNLGNLITRTEARINNKDKWKNSGVNFNLRHVLDSTGSEITMDADYVNYQKRSDQRFDNYFFDNADVKKQPDEFLKAQLPSDITIYSAKADYTHPLKGNAKFEAGVKTSFVQTDNNAKYANKVNGEWIADAARSNHFIYEESINAAYVNSSKEFNKKWSGQLGLRVENTVSKGNQATTGEQFERNYTQVFPTAYVGYVMNKKNQFSLSYGRRINRPNYQDMNPFLYFLDKYTYEAGNPYLKPQFSHNIDLTHSFNSFLNTSINFSNTRDIIQQVLKQVDSTNTTFVTRENIAQRRNFGLSVSANVPVKKWWRANIYANVLSNHFEGLVNGSRLDVDGIAFTTNISNQFTFKKGWAAELSGFYRSKNIEGTLVANPMGMTSIGVSKQVLKNKGTVKLNVRDFLDLQKFSGYSRFQNIDVRIKNEWDNRVANVTFTYRFGKTNQNTPQRKKGGTSDEQSRVNAGASNN
jgi:hypothetical protein